VSDIEQSWKKFHDASGVKNCMQFEGVRPGFYNLARRVKNPTLLAKGQKQAFYEFITFEKRRYFRQNSGTKRMITV
jgi:hypothetical protein